jgi:Fe-S-cluster containining protein
MEDVDEVGSDAILSELHAQIEERCRKVAETRPPWPCHRGCDSCCRNLAEAPRLVRAEWQRLERGLEELADDVRAEVETRLEGVAAQEGGPVLCPFLDTEAGACRVYEHRPAACRTYGFYQDRDGGRYCHLVEAHVEDDGPEDRNDDRAALRSVFEGIIWGSQPAIDQELERHLGPTIPLRRWWRERQEREGGPDAHGS